jgi:exonuclease SbcC
MEEIETLKIFLKKNSKNEVEKELSQFEKITKTLDSYRQKRMHLEQKKENISLRLVSLREKIQVLASEIDKEKNIIETFDVNQIGLLKSKMLEIKSNMSSLLERKEKQLLKSGGLQAQKQILAEQVQSINNTINELKLQKALTDAFSKTGVPSLVLKTQLPAINNELQKLLMSIQDFSVSLDLDLGSNSMDVFIEDVTGKREIELGSGAEKMITSLALRVALLNLSALPKPDILIIDEGFGSLDDENLQKCMEFLDVLKAYFKSVIIVTHVSPLKEVTDQLIEIIRDGHRSKVQH